MPLSPTLNIYKNLLRFASNLPAERKLEALQRIRKEFRDNLLENDSSKIQELLKYAQSSLGYLKIVTPKHQFSNQSGRTKIVFGTEKGMPTKAISNWTGKNLDPDSVARHYRGLKRAGFRDNNHAKGFF